MIQDHRKGAGPAAGTAPVGGMALLRNPALHKGTAFTEEEREVLGLRGLLPPRVFTQDEQLQRVLRPSPPCRRGTSRS